MTFDLIDNRSLIGGGDESRCKIRKNKGRNRECTDSEGMTEIIWSDVIIVHKGEFIRNIFYY